MSDNQEEIHRENSEPVETIGTSSQPVDLIPQQPTATMEVHHHGHHHGPKTWKSYVWEFIMLFLAVFCGFLAEWQLEHSIEHSREKQFVKSLMQDIRTDQQNIAKLDEQYSRILLQIDSLKSQLAGEEVFTNSYPAYRNWLSAFRFPDFIPTDGTVKQLLGSGGLRLIGKQEVVDSIMAYQREVEMVRIHQQNLNTILTNSPKPYDLFDLIRIGKGETATPIPLLTTDKKTINRVYGETDDWRIGVRGLRARVKLVRERGNGLINVVKEKYDIE